jgi:hypothetical protein
MVAREGAVMVTIRSFRRSLRASTVAFGLAASVLVAGAATTSAQPPAPEDVLSHFLCYEGDFPPFAGAQVQLIEELGAFVTQVGGPHLFCNPVRKKRGDVVTRIVDVRQHLKVYRIRTDPAGPETLKVSDSNQFGADQVLTIQRSPTRLMVPTRKWPHDPPAGLDHFACHAVKEGKAIEKPVLLRDQFVGFRTRVLKPLLHCEPTQKIHGDRTFNVRNPQAHLVCYSIEPRRLDPPQTRRTRNQFEKAPITARVATRLCVPSRSEIVPVT